MLDAELERSDAEHVLVCLHHHPVPVGSAWLDAVGLDDGDELLAVIGRHPRMCGLLWGHVHQRYDDHAGGLRLMGTLRAVINSCPAATTSPSTVSAPATAEFNSGPMDASTPK